MPWAVRALLVLLSQQPLQPLSREAHFVSQEIGQVIHQVIILKLLVILWGKQSKSFKLLMSLFVSPRETNEKGPHLRTRHRNGLGWKHQIRNTDEPVPMLHLVGLEVHFSAGCIGCIPNFAAWISSTSLLGYRFVLVKFPFLVKSPAMPIGSHFLWATSPKSFACMGVYLCFAENCGPTVDSFLTNFGGFARSQRRTLSTLPVSHPHFRYLDLEWLRYEFVLDNLTPQHICSSSIPFLDPQDRIPMLY